MGRKVFVNREHQWDWMNAGGAREMNALQPLEAKVKGGSISGQQAVESGRLHEHALRSAMLAREAAAEYRAKRGL